MNLQLAEQLANEIVSRLQPYCTAIAIAGSIRRKKAEVRDADIVLRPAPGKYWELVDALHRLGATGPLGKMKRFFYRGMSVDLYFADEKTWATLLLIRTGPTEQNIRLCAEAKSRGWHLHANGAGLFDGDGRRLAGDTEESIYEALGESYKAPTERG